VTLKITRFSFDGMEKEGIEMLLELFFFGFMNGRESKLLKVPMFILMQFFTMSLAM
jgi:hypothetical protein